MVSDVIVSPDRTVCTLLYDWIVTASVVRRASVIKLACTLARDGWYQLLPPWIAYNNPWKICALLGKGLVTLVALLYILSTIAAQILEAAIRLQNQTNHVERDPVMRLSMLTSVKLTGIEFTILEMAVGESVYTCRSSRQTSRSSVSTSWGPDHPRQSVQV